MEKKMEEDDRSTKNTPAETMDLPKSRIAGVLPGDGWVMTVFDFPDEPETEEEVLAFIVVEHYGYEDLDDNGVPHGTRVYSEVRAVPRQFPCIEYSPYYQDENFSYRLLKKKVR
jgi:hypothetical protein